MSSASDTLLIGDVAIATAELAGVRVCLWWRHIDASGATWHFIMPDGKQSTLIYHTRESAAEAALKILEGGTEEGARIDDD